MHEDVFGNIVYESIDRLYRIVPGPLHIARPRLFFYGALDASQLSFCYKSGEAHREETVRRIRDWKRDGKARQKKQLL